jgi:hypothetical protein
VIKRKVVEEDLRTAVFRCIELIIARRKMPTDINAMTYP